MNNLRSNLTAAEVREQTYKRELNGLLHSRSSVTEQLKVRMEHEDYIGNRSAKLNFFIDNYLDLLALTVVYIFANSSLVWRFVKVDNSQLQLRLQERSKELADALDKLRRQGGLIESAENEFIALKRSVHEAHRIVQEREEHCKCNVCNLQLSSKFSRQGHNSANSGRLTNLCLNNLVTRLQAKLESTTSLDNKLLGNDLLSIQGCWK